MEPNDVYVLFDNRNEEIVSVHSFRHFALIARNDAITRGFKTEDDRIKLGLRFVVTTLLEAQGWLKSPPWVNNEVEYDYH